MRQLRVLLLLVFVPSLLAQEFAVTQPVPVPGVENRFPAAATSGAFTFVTWSDTRNGHDIDAAWLDAAGRVLNPDGTLLAHGALYSSVTATGSGDFLVALSGLDRCGQVDVLKVGHDGRPSARKTVIDISPRCASNVQMATNGDSVLMLINDTRFVLLDNDGNALTTSATLTDRDDPSAVASDGRGYAIAIATPTNVQTIAVSRDGVAAPAQVVFPATDVVSVAMAANAFGYLVAAASHTQLILNGKSLPLSERPIAVRLVWDGTSYVIAWTQAGTLETARVNGAGDLQSVIPIGASDPFFALTPAMTVRVDASRIVARATGGEDVFVVMTPSPQVAPLMVSTTSGAVVLWQEVALGVTKAETLDAAGQPSGRAVTVEPAALAAFDGTNLVLVWTASGTLFARRYSTALVPVDPVPIAIAQNAIPAALAAGGGTALFIWQSGAALLPSAGAPVPVALPSLFLPAAVWGGGEYLVAQALPAGSPSNVAALTPDIRIFRVTPTGAVVDMRTIAHLTKPVRAMGAASNGGNFVVMWQPFTEDLPDTMAEFVGADGTAEGSAIAIAPSTPIQPPLLVPFDSRYLAVWQTDTVHWRSIGAGTVQSLPAPNVPSGIAAAAAGSRVMLAYSRIDQSAGGVARLFVRAIVAPRTRAAR